MHICTHMYTQIGQNLLIFAVATAIFMANISFYLDTRRTKNGAPSVMKIVIYHNRERALVSTSCKITPEQWDDEKKQVINCDDSVKFNTILQGTKNQIESLVRWLEYEKKIDQMSANDIKNMFEAQFEPEKRARITKKVITFEDRYLKFSDTKTPSTKRLYTVTYNRMLEFCKERNIRFSSLTFEDITRDWLASFDLFLSVHSPSKNARNIHFRNIRAVFNDAIDDEITTFYPFRKFKIRNVATRKRNLKVEDLRTLFNYPVEKCNKGYLDIFKLMFMLIGINTVDLANLKEIKDGRVDFYRAKTHRLYSIKVEPEALEIIERYKGKEWLVDILDRYKDHKDYTKHINMALKKIGPVTRSGLGGKKTFNPLFPDISTYWARHSWATIAASLDIPKDTIAHALGHGNNTVTDIYIDFDQNKVDEANRRVLDWVLYGKK